MNKKNKRLSVVIFVLTLCSMLALLAACGDGKSSESGESGESAKSAYQQYIEKYPDYDGTEEEWLKDLLDGKLNEKSWAKAAETESFVDISGEDFPKPKYDTKARMMWDDDYLYVSAVLEEPNIVANLTQRDTII